MQPGSRREMDRDRKGIRGASSLLFVSFVVCMLLHACSGHLWQRASKQFTLYRKIRTVRSHTV